MPTTANNASVDPVTFNNVAPEGFDVPLTSPMNVNPFVGTPNAFNTNIDLSTGKPPAMPSPVAMPSLPALPEAGDFTGLYPSAAPSSTAAELAYRGIVPMAPAFKAPAPPTFAMPAPVAAPAMTTEDFLAEAAAQPASVVAEAKGVEPVQVASVVPGAEVKIAASPAASVVPEKPVATPAVETIKPVAAGTATLSSLYSGSVGAMARTGMPAKSIIEATQLQYAPVPEDGGYEGRAESLNAVSAKLANEAALLDTALQGTGLTPEQKMGMMTARDSFLVASGTAAVEASKIASFSGSDVGKKIEAASIGDPSAFGVPDAVIAHAGNRVQGLLATAASAADANPKMAASIVRNVQSQLDSLTAELKAERISNGVTVKNGLGEVVGVDMTTMLSAGALGLGLYQALYAAPAEADKQREWQLKLMQMQYTNTRQLQSDAIAAEKEIAGINAGAMVAAAEAGKSKGTPSSVNPGVHL